MESKGGFDGKTIIVIVLCMGVWFLWQQHLEKKYPDSFNPTTTTAPNTKTTEAPKGSHEKALQQPDWNAKDVDVARVNGPEKKWIYEDSVWKVTVSSYGARISEVILKNYTDRQGKPITLVSPTEPGYLLTEVKGQSTNFAGLNYTLNSRSKESVELEAVSGGVTVKKTLTVVPEKYIIKNVTTIDNKAKIQGVSVTVSQPSPSANQSSGPSFLNRGAGAEIQEFFFNHGNKTNRDIVAPNKPFEKDYDQTHFASLGSRYFTTLLFNRGNIIPSATGINKGAYSYLDLTYPVLDPNEPMTIEMDVYAGPKVFNQLKAVDEQAVQVVDFGFFSWIAVPLLEVMKYFFKLFNNYGLAIILLTLLVRVVTLPFTYVSYKSMKSMQRIQPELQRIKEIYKDNKEKLHMETMKLMKDNKVNPAGGCLPLLLQLPIFWALYQVLQNSIELYHSPFMGWIHDLSVKDPFYILPALMCISMVAQQKLTPNTMDPAQAKMMMFMPLMFGFLMMSLPAGLTLYIFVSTVFGILQQLLMTRNSGQPALVRRA